MSSPSCRQINRAAVEVPAASDGQPQNELGRGSLNPLRRLDARLPHRNCEPRHSAARRQWLIPSLGRSCPDREEAWWRSSVTDGVWLMSIVETRFAARRVDSVARNERMFAATCICVEILVAALAIYALGSAILLQAPAASPPQNKAPAAMSFVGP
jgi:F0F1-type ATP synthase membrane subunit c/vacuolar-type H+-ATPase subunit K